MGQLTDLLGDHKRLVGRVKIAAPAPTKLRSAVTAIKSAGDVAKLYEETSSLQRRVATIIRENSAYQLSKSDLRAISSVFLHSPEPPGRDAAIGDKIIAEIGRRGARSPVLALFNAYLDGFKHDDADIIRLAGHLNTLTDKDAWRGSDNWAVRARKLSLFDPREAPGRLAATVLSSLVDPKAALAEAGLNTDVRTSGALAEEAFRLGCLAAARVNGPACTNMQRRIIAWAHNESGNLVFPGSFTQFATALLEPWSTVEPDTTYRSELIQVLDHAGGGDPRTNPARWRTLQQQAPNAYAILLKWLTQATVMQFLDIVGRSMRDANGRRMWSYRRAFWTSYLLGTDGGPTIQKAWIAFGSEAAGLARDAAKESGDKSFTAFGRQYDKSHDHSALIMDFGDLLVVDWSHSAKYNVWRARDPGKPQLFQTSYPSGTLYNAPIKDSHVAPANYTWQKKMAKIIEGRNFFSEKPSWRPKNV